MTMPSRRVPGESDDPYAERRARITLVEALARLINDQGSIEMVAIRSGLRPEMIRSDVTPVGMWTAVLAYAADIERIDYLVNEALTLYPDDPRLTAAAERYRNARGS